MLSPSPVRDTPIIFSAPMIRALLDGRKTMTRRLAWRSETDTKRMSFLCDGEKPNPLARKAKGFGVQMSGEWWLRPTPWVSTKPGDRLWVRESWADDAEAAWEPQKHGTYYRADLNAEEIRANNLSAGIPHDWHSPLHLHRYRSRLTLIVTATKIERLQNITPAEATAEGVERGADRDYHIGPDIRTTDPVGCFSALWWSLHGIGTWDANPEVVALSFKVHKQNIDTLPKSEAA